QAEDGIRFLYVTGVQTCALPIFSSVLPSASAVSGLVPRSTRPWMVGKSPSSAARREASSDCADTGNWTNRPNTTAPTIRIGRKRSEERRVGKECMYRETTDLNIK